jgi:hypothetical protein
MATELAGNPFAGLATGMVESVQLQWGWALLVAGAGAREAALALNAKGLAEALQAERPRNGSGTRNSLPKPEWPRSIDAHREI